MDSKSSSAEVKKQAEALVNELLKLLGVGADVDVLVKEELVSIKIEGDDLGLLIGYRGENLESLQLFLGIALNKKLAFEKWRPVLVDVGSWRAQKEEALRSYVAKEITKISAENPAVKLSPMSPSQRRIVHILIQEHGDLTSESEGDEPNRAVLIKREKKS